MHMACNQPLSAEIERQQAALALIGGALLLVQTAESAIKACMTYALPKHSPLTLKALQQQQGDERKRTLGYFLHELRKRADINASFDVELGRFLEDRNTLV